MTLLVDIRQILNAGMSDDLAETLIVSLVSRATGLRRGRRVGAQPASDERSSTLGEGLTTPTKALEGVNSAPPLDPPGSDLSSSGSSLCLFPVSETGSLEASSPEVVRKSGRDAGGETEEFRDWYREYPKKRSRRDAWKAWGQVARHRPPLAVLRAALDWQRVSHEWTKNGGEYIPFPATYLRRHNWADEQTDIQGDGMSDRERRGVANSKAWLAGMRGR